MMRYYIGIVLTQLIVSPWITTLLFSLYMVYEFIMTKRKVFAYVMLGMLVLTSLLTTQIYVIIIVAMALFVVIRDIEQARKSFMIVNIALAIALLLAFMGWHFVYVEKVVLLSVYFVLFFYTSPVAK